MSNLIPGCSASNEHLVVSQSGMGTAKYPERVTRKNAHQMLRRWYMIEDELEARYPFETKGDKELVSLKAE